MANKLTRQRLKEVLHYSPDTGIFVWLKRTSNRVEIGSMAGSLEGTGYQSIRIDKIAHLAHRLAFLYMEGYFPENDVDHINRVRDDNRWENLRHVSRSCNMRNKTKPVNNISGVVGVSWDKNRGKWTGMITINYRQFSLGRFDTLKSAVQARWEAEKKYGFPNCNSTSTAYRFLKGEES